MASSEDHFDWGTYVESFESTKSGSSLGVSYDEEAPNYENFVSGSQSLADHLMWQLRMENLTDEEFELSSLIIGNINDDGYLSVSFGEVVEQSNLSPEDAEDLLLMIQRFDPIGLLY